MTRDQLVLFALLGLVFALLVWGRWRYDLVAFLALVVAVLTGVVPTARAFAGFGHPATVIIALVLIVSRALSNSGAIELVARFLVDRSRSLGAHIAVMSGFAALLSALMNNVAALALLMPVDMEAAAKAKRSPSLSLMPLSFASILGGMITLIGTPPNVVVAEYRNEALGSPYLMFDFTPVGFACALVGVTFVATLGWRLVPRARHERDTSTELFELAEYVAELEVPEDAPCVGKQVRELDDATEEHESAIVGLVRRGKRMPGLARRARIRAGDILVVEAHPDRIDKLVGALGLQYLGQANDKRALVGEDLSLLEVVVPEGARIEGRTALSLRLLYRHGVTLLGVSRRGHRFTERVRKLAIRAGDVLLLLGPSERLHEISEWLGALPLAERGLQVVQRQKAWLTIGIFGAAVLLASLGMLYLPIALAGAVGLLVLLSVVPLRQVYDAVEWPVIVLLGCMIPIGSALESSGGTTILASGIVGFARGFSPVLVLVLLMVVTMTLSDVMNNVATAVIAAPGALDVAERLGTNPDPFLMGVAVAASCAFLTPIGHKNNTLILGPGGYDFGDYWRMGLPLELLIVVVATPMILWVWPL
ncbi:MAG: SLC13 family permease [Gemmatimonadales bacterium]